MPVKPFRKEAKNTLQSQFLNKNQNHRNLKIKSNQICQVILKQSIEVNCKCHRYQVKIQDLFTRLTKEMQRYQI